MVNASGSLARERSESAHDRSVRDVSDDGYERCPAAVIEQQEAGLLQEGCGTSRVDARSHSWVHRGEQDVHQRAAGERGVDEAEKGAEQETALTDDGED